MYSNINDSLNSLVFKTHIILKGKLQSLLNDHDITSGQWVILRKLYEIELTNITTKRFDNDILVEGYITAIEQIERGGDV